MRLKKEDYLRIVFTKVVSYVNVARHVGEDVIPELDDVYNYITKTRKQLFEDKRNFYPKRTDFALYYDYEFSPDEHTAYSKIMRSENIINDLDQEMVQQTMKYKDILWIKNDSSSANVDVEDS